jgi:CubicO group peptidase (beta-lactamase class C family)
MGQLYRELNVKVTDTPRTLEELVNAYFYPQGDLYASTNFADTQPGEVVEYSNLAATLAAYVVEVASGMSYETFLQIHILDPLSMHATGFAGTEVSPSQHASSYIDDVPLPFYRLESFPDGGLRSTINDLSLYLLDMMEGQKGQSDVLFAPSVYNTLFTKQGEFSLFWSASGQGSFSHTGGDPGISTLMGFGPNIKGGVVLIMNIDSEAGGNEGFIDDLWAQKIGPLAKRYLHTAPSAR